MTDRPTAASGSPRAGAASGSKVTSAALGLVTMFGLTAAMGYAHTSSTEEPAAPLTPAGTAPVVAAADTTVASAPAPAPVAAAPIPLTAQRRVIQAQPVVRSAPAVQQPVVRSAPAAQQPVAQTNGSR